MNSVICRNMRLRTMNHAIIFSNNICRIFFNKILINQSIYPKDQSYNQLLLGLDSYFMENHSFNNLKEMIKTTNIIPALNRKVYPPIKLNKSPPIINPTMLARLPKLLATPCINP